MATKGAGISLRLLGEMEVFRGSVRVELPPSRKSRALLAYLAATGRPQRRERLCSLFWEVPDDPRGSLRWSLSRLRAVLEEDDSSCILANRETVSLDTSRCAVDLLSLRALDRSRLEEVETARLLEAVDAFRGEFLEGLDLANCHEFQSWCLAEREELRRLNIDLLAELRRRHDADPEAALGFVRRLVHVDPFDEAARVDLLRLLLGTGRRREAQGQFETAERLLRELGEGSADRLRRAWRTILRDTERGVTVTAAPATRRPPAVRPIPASPRQPAAAADSACAPFVGRRWMLDHLTDALGSAAASGRARVVLLMGEPGLGKSRLLSELAACATASGARTVIGHCYESRLGASYACWEEALQELPPLDAEGDADLRRKRLFQAVAGAVVGEADAFTLLALEDVQWMDEASCDVLRFVLRAARQTPLLVLLTAREGEIADNAAVAGVLRELREKHDFQSLHLLPLSEEEVRLLAAASGQPSSIERIVSLSRGNPLYALELSRGLIEEQQSLPRSLKELIRDRLDRLPPEAAEVLRWSSLFSAGVEVPLLQDLSDLGESSFLSALEALDRHRLLAHDPRSDSCTFSHELVREAVYTSLSEPRRRLMHRKVARLLNAEIRQGKVDPFDVVHHASAAGDDVMAAEACVQAGRRARRLLANGEALMLVRRGQHHAEALPEPLRSERLIELTEVELSIRSLDDAELLAQRLEQLAGTALDHDRPALAWRCYKMLADVRWAQGSWSDARLDTLHAELISRNVSEEERVAALGEAARCLTMLERDLDFAETLVLQGQALSERLGLYSDAIADASGLLAAYRGEVEEARQSFLQARLLARQRGHRLEEFLALSHLVMLELEQENWEGVSRACGDLTSLARKIRPGAEQPFAAAVTALCRNIAGPKGDLRDLEDALEALRVADSKHHMSIVCLNAARLYLQRGAREQAQQLAAEALEAASVLTRRRTQAAALSLLAEIAAASGDDATPWNERLRALGATGRNWPAAATP